MSFAYFEMTSGGYGLHERQTALRRTNLYEAVIPPVGTPGWEPWSSCPRAEPDPSVVDATTTTTTAPNPLPIVTPAFTG